MSQIKPSHLIISLAVALALGGCGDKNPQAQFSPEGGHPAGWTVDHKSSAKANLSSCIECHGENLDGGVSKVSCTTCHTSAVPSGANAAGCTSCHGAIPDGSSNSFPNRNLSHDKHANLPGVTCNTCHNGFGYSTENHGTLASARLSLDPVFKAKAATSAPAYSRNGSGGVSCTNVSCHGGQPTPVCGGGHYRLHLLPYFGDGAASS